MNKKIGLIGDGQWIYGQESVAGVDMGPSGDAFMQACLES